MKALSLWQPWAGLMEVGAKRNETRSWSTNYRGDLAICSAKKRAPVPADIMAQAKGVIQTSFRYGFVLCVVRLHGVVPTEVERLIASFQELAYGDYSDGRFAWQTDNLRRLSNPVAVIGRQSLFNLPADVEAKVRAQL